MGSEKRQNTPLTQQCAQKIAHYLSVTFPLLRIDLHRLQRLLNHPWTGYVVFFEKGLGRCAVKCETLSELDKKAFRREDDTYLDFVVALFRSETGSTALEVG